MFARLGLGRWRVHLPDAGAASRLGRGRTVGASRRRRTLASKSDPPWYHTVEDASERARVLELRNADYRALNDLELRRLTENWFLNDTSAFVRLSRREQDLSVRPFWVSVCLGTDGTSRLYVTFLPIDESTESAFLAATQPQARLDNQWTFNGADRVSGRWRNYFVGLSGDLGFDWHTTLFPNLLFHEDRCVRDVESFHRMGQFLADPTKERIELHRANILALDEKHNWGKNFNFQLLKSRWGTRALLQNDIQI